MLNGSLESFALQDVLRFVAGSNATGRVEIEREEVSGELSIDQGRFVAARLSDEEAPATEDEALDVAVLLFDGSGGTFSVTHEDWAGGPLDLDADQLVSAVDKRRQQWAEVVEKLGSLDDPLTLIADLPAGTEEVVVSAKQWRLLSLIDGTRSAQDVARDAGESIYATAVALAELAARGLVAHGEARAADDGSDGGDTAEDAAEMLREIGGVDTDTDAEADDDGEDDPPKGKKRATVRPLRVPTREEQRVRLRR